MRITVTLTDGTARTVDKLSLATQVRFEKAFGLRMADLAPRTDPLTGLTEDGQAGVEHIAWLAHHELLRGQKNGRFAGVEVDFDAFLDQVEEFTVATETDEEGAGDPNPSPEPVTPSGS